MAKYFAEELKRKMLYERAYLQDEKKFRGYKRACKNYYD